MSGNLLADSIRAISSFILNKGSPFFHSGHADVFISFLRLRRLVTILVIKRAEEEMSGSDKCLL